MQLVRCQEGESDVDTDPLVSYHWKLAKGQSYLEIHERGVMKDLDYIVGMSSIVLVLEHVSTDYISVTFLIMEKRRRDD